MKEGFLAALGMTSFIGTPAARRRLAGLLLGASGVALLMSMPAMLRAQSAGGGAKAGASSASNAVTGSATTGNAKNGEKLFVSYGCYECHGRHAEGSSSSGPRLGPNVVNLALLQTYIRQPTGQMPPYTTKVLPDADLAEIFAFLQAQAPAAKNIPELK